MLRINKITSFVNIATSYLCVYKNAIAKRIGFMNMLAELKKQESLLHNPKSKLSRVDFENIIDSEFFEIGASGKRHDRNDTINTLVNRYQNKYSKNDIWLTKDFEYREIASNCYLVTYTLIQEKENRITRRTTIWRRDRKQWEILYHQGTLVL